MGRCHRQSRFTKDEIKLLKKIYCEQQSKGKGDCIKATCKIFLNNPTNHRKFDYGQVSERIKLYVKPYYCGLTDDELLHLKEKNLTKAELDAAFQMLGEKYSTWKKGIKLRYNNLLKSHRDSSKGASECDFFSKFQNSTFEWDCIREENSLF